MGLSFQDRYGPDDLAYGTGIRALVTHGGDRLYALATSVGGLTAFEIAGDGGLGVINSAGLTSGLAVGAPPQLLVVDHLGAPHLLVAGQPLSLALRSLGPDGAVGAPVPFSGALDPAIAPAWLEIGGRSFLYSAASGGGITIREVLAGSVASRGGFADTPEHGLAGIAAMLAGVVEGAPYLIAASASENTITRLAVGADGALSKTGQIGAADGLGLNAPSVMAQATNSAGTFVFVGSTGSSSISVLQLREDGQLALRDHVLDDLATRFAGITALDAMVLGDVIYLAAAGRDDGVTLLSMLPDGRLVQEAVLADTLALALQDVSAVKLSVAAGRPQLHVASESEAGLTRLTLDISALGLVRLGTAAGETLQGDGAGDRLDGAAGDDILRGFGGDDRLYGGSGNDRLEGGRQDDLLYDGPGLDVLVGGDGADLFVFAADGQTDRIEDFEPGIDRLDLSQFAGLYLPSQLQVTLRGDGADLAYGDEVIELRTRDGAPLDPAGLTAAGILGLNRPPFVPADQSLVGTPLADTLTGGLGRDLIEGLAGDDALRGEAGDDVIRGGTGEDLLEGGPGDDLLEGDAGFDVIRGGPGDDTLRGGDQADVLEGEAGADLLEGGNGLDILRGGDDADTLRGGAQDDRLWGGPGDDALWGDAGNDAIYGEAGSDEAHGRDDDDILWGGAQDDVLFGGLGNDTLSGDLGDDLILGDGGFDVLYGGPGADVINGGGQADVLYGGPGPDRLLGEGGTDRIYGGEGRDFIRAGAGDDVAFGEAGNDLIYGSAGDDRLWGGTGDDRLLGEEGDDRLWGGAGFDLLVGGPGNDVMTGNFNADTFVFADGHGQDRITDFEALNPFEKIRLSDVSAIRDWDDLLDGRMVQQGADLRIDTGTGSILLENVRLADLDAGDFLF